MFNCSSIWREAFRLQLLLLLFTAPYSHLWYFCDIYLLVVTISIFLGNIVLLFQTKNKFSEVWLEAWQTKAGHLPCGIGNVFVTQAYKSEYWAVSWPQTKVTFRKAIFYKKQKIESETLSWLVAGCTPEGGQQFRAHQTIQAADWHSPAELGWRNQSLAIAILDCCPTHWHIWATWAVLAKEPWSGTKIFC